MNGINTIRTKSFLPLNFIVTFICFVDTHMLIPVLALYAASLGASVGIIGLIVGLYSITNIPANIFFGRVIDKVGYKIPLVLGLLGDALSMFAYSLTRSPLHLAFLRIFHGLAGGAAGPATMSAMSHHTASGKKGRGMSLYGMALAAATLVGYGLSGMLASRWGYSSVFYFGAGLAFVAMLGMMALIRE